MQPTDLHQLLISQLNEKLGANPELSESFKSLLAQISETYQNYDTNLKTTKQQFELRTAQLIASTSNAYSFLDSLNMGFIMCDVNTQVVLTNNSAKKILSTNLASDDKPQQPQNSQFEWNIDNLDRLLQPDIKLKELVLLCLKSSKPQEAKEVNAGKSVLHLFIAPMINEDSDGNKHQIGAIILVEDITEQKVLERSKDEFLSIASHELRTPLTAIRGNAALIKKYYGDRLPDEDTVEMIDDIHESSVRLIEIVNDFLDVSAIEQGKIIMNPETFLIDEVVDDVMYDLQGLCDLKGIKLLKDNGSASINKVYADKQRIKQVLYNLVGNAIKFTDSGSVTINNSSDGNYVYIKIIDTGRGMSSENQHLLFRKFQQAGSSLLTRDNTKGTGLGLYISKLIIELSDGKIELEHSELGKGSTFVFSIPVAKN
jgi:signal transduction histidine kinase